MDSITGPLSTLPPGPPAGASQRVGGFVTLPALLRTFDVEPAELFLATGLDPVAFDDADSRVPFLALSRLLGAASLRTGCGHFGLLAGKCWTLSHMGLVGELMRHSATLGEALETLAVYQRLNSQGGIAFLRVEQHDALLGYAICETDVPHADHVFDAVLAMAVNFIRELVAGHWNPAEVALSRTRPASTRPYSMHFNAPIRFDAGKTQLRFPRRWLAHPIQGAMPARRGELEELAEKSSRTDLIESLRRSLYGILGAGSPTGDDLAQELGMHRRTLNRRLEMRGTSFHAELEQARFNVARQLLDTTGNSLASIAVALGYSESSAFVRAFRRWSGTTPRAWRESQRPRAPAQRARPR